MNSYLRFSRHTFSLVCSISLSLICLPASAHADYPAVNAGPDRIVSAGEPVVLTGLISRGVFNRARFHWSQVIAPDLTESLSSFNCPVDWSDQYATRVRGWLHPPATGDYTFWIALDDGSVLYLSTDRIPDNKRVIAAGNDWTSSHEWNKFPSQHSQPIHFDI